MKAKTVKKAVTWILQNYLILIFMGCIGFVGVVSVYKLFIKKPVYIYVKVKMGQGLWWASTQKPSMWFIQAIKDAKEEKDLTGKPVVQIEKVTYYPWYSGNQYDVYITAKIRVSKVGSAGKYNYQRSTIGVGAPIDFEFNTVQFSGTVIQLSQKPIKDEYVEKTVTLTKKGAYPWEFDSIQIGDAFNNGEVNIFSVLDKQATETYTMIGDQLGNYLPLSSEMRKYIVVKVKVKGKIENNKFVFGEEQFIIPGKSVSITTPSFVFNDYTVAQVE